MTCNLEAKGSEIMCRHIIKIIRAPHWIFTKYSIHQQGLHHIFKYSNQQEKGKTKENYRQGKTNAIHTVKSTPSSYKSWEGKGNIPTSAMQTVTGMQFLCCRQNGNCFVVNCSVVVCWFRSSNELCSKVRSLMCCKYEMEKNNTCIFFLRQHKSTFWTTKSSLNSHLSGHLA